MSTMRNICLLGLLGILSVSCRMLGGSQHAGPRKTYDAIFVNELLSWSGGSVTMSLTVKESRSVLRHYDILKTTPWEGNAKAMGKLPNRLYLSGKLVERGSKEESEILAIMRQLASSESTQQAYFDYHVHLLSRLFLERVELEDDKERLSSADLDEEAKSRLTASIAARETILSEAVYEYLNDSVPPDPERVQSFAEGFADMLLREPIPEKESEPNSSETGLFDFDGF